MTPIIPTSTTIDNQVVFATVFIDPPRVRPVLCTGLGENGSFFLNVLSIHRPAPAAAAAGPAGAPVWKVPVSGTPIGPTGM